MKKVAVTEEKTATEDADPTENNKGNDDNEGKDNEEKDNDNDEVTSWKCMYKKKINIKQGKKDYKKWMAQLKSIKNDKDNIKKMDENLSSMIIEYRKKLQNEGTDILEESTADVIDVPDSDDDEENNKYIDFDTLGGGVFAV